MKHRLLRHGRALLWQLARWLHRLDYAWFLPRLARLPRPVAFALSAWRGRFNAALGRDWRSMALRTRHIQRQSLKAYALLAPTSSAKQRAQWCAQRFATEARDELEAQWVAAGRLHELHYQIAPPQWLALCRQRQRGLVLLTPHFDSFYVGIALLAQATGARVHSMSSAVSRDPRVDSAVSRHFDTKYRGLERYLNGGQVLDMEQGLRPFYRMLEAHDILVVLADAPVLPQGAALTVDFLGARRRLAGGAWRLAQRTGSDVGGFVCRHLGGGRYTVELCVMGPSSDDHTLARIYEFFSARISADPGRWWAADLLEHMPVVPDNLAS